ncbi:MAG: hypothetical protein FWE14_01910 [Lachnospiraceae bacterium]|nr:hypothetical protein [Lachnospiraceae bacterium]
MRIPVAIYPYCAELLPIVKYFEKMQEKYVIARLISPPGLGLGGKDAAYARNHPSVGHIVTDEFYADDLSWTILIITRVFQPNVFNDKKISSIAVSALAAGKKVLYFDNHQKNVPDSIVTLANDYPDDIITITADTQLLNLTIGDGNFKELETPVIIVGGLVAAEDTLEVSLSIADCLQKQGQKITIISKHNHSKILSRRFHSLIHIFNNNELTEVEKIIIINSYMKDLEQSEMPDIIIVEAPDSVMRYNNTIFHDFGIHTYMLCQAMNPDYFVCCIPNDLADGNFIKAINKDLSYRLGAAIGAVHISNIIVDSADITHSKKISYVHTNLGLVKNQIKKQSNEMEISFFDVVKDGADGICAILFD